MLQRRLQIRDRDIGGKLPGKQIAADAGHQQQQHDGDDTDEDIGDHQPMAQPPHEMPPGPTEGKPQATECENRRYERRPATQLRSWRGAGDPAQSDEEHTQSTQPKRGAAPLGAWAERPPGPTKGKPQGTECENRRYERRPATQLRSCHRTGDPAQSDHEAPQPANPQRGAAQLAAARSVRIAPALAALNSASL